MVVQQVVDRIRPAMSWVNLVEVHHRTSRDHGRQEAEVKDLRGPNLSVKYSSVGIRAYQHATVEARRRPATKASASAASSSFLIHVGDNLLQAFFELVTQ